MEKEVYSKVFNNIILKSLIFQNVKSIHRTILLNPDPESDFHTWEQLTSNRNNILIAYDYFDLFIEFKKKKNLKRITKFELYQMIKKGKVEFLERLVKNDVEFEEIKPYQLYHPQDIFLFALLSGKVEMVEFLDSKFSLSTELENSLQPTKHRTLMEAAIRNVKLLQWIDRTLSFDFDTYYLDIYLVSDCIDYGNLETLKWMLQKKNCQDFIDNDGLIINRTLSNGYLDIVEFLADNRYIPENYVSDLDEIICKYIAKYEHSCKGSTLLECVKWANTHYKTKCTTESIDCLAENGFLDIIMYLNEYRNVGYTNKAINGAEKNGHIAVLNWLQENPSK